jgi:hypothetical protein
LRSIRVAPGGRPRHSASRRNEEAAMPLRFSAIPTAAAEALRSGGPDAYGRPAERAVSDGGGNPCRHCLRDIPAGAAMLILAWRPFPAAQPYAETGPVFLCAEPCARHPDTPEPPPVIAGRKRFMVRGYGGDHRIVYGTGAVVATADLVASAEAMLADPGVAYLHLRSASNGCYQARVDRG